MEKDAFVIVQKGGDWVGIHRTLLSAKYHLSNRKRYFPTKEMWIEEVKIIFKK